MASQALLINFYFPRCVQSDIMYNSNQRSGLKGGLIMEYVQPIRDKKQIENMKRFLRESNLRDWLLFILGINSGLRISDLLKLTVEDVAGQDRISIEETKTGKN